MKLFKKIKKTIADGSTFTVTADENRDIDAAIVQLLMSDFSFYSTKEEPDVFVQGYSNNLFRLKKFLMFLKMLMLYIKRLVHIL